MTGWRTIGEGLKSQWREMHEGLAERAEDHFNRIERDAPMLFAVIRHRRGDAEAIPSLLRSDTPLTPDDRDTLAFFLEGGFEGRPRGPGALRELAVQIAGKVAYFVDEWKEICRLNKISTYGATEDMRIEVAKFIRAELGLTKRVKIETVLEYVRKGKVKSPRQKAPHN